MKSFPVYLKRSAHRFFTQTRSLMMEEMECVVRPVMKKDLPALSALESQRWGREGTDILSTEDVANWYREHSPFFLVATIQDVLVGYHYGVQVEFKMTAVDDFVATSIYSDSKYTSRPHEPKGNCVYVDTVVAKSSQAGAAISREVDRLLIEKKMEYLLGFSRLACLDRYLKNIELANNGTLPCSEEDAALWYAQKSMEMLGGKIWSECTKKSGMNLPVPRRPDPILKFHIQGRQLKLLRVIKNYMTDPKSRGYAALIVSNHLSLKK